MNALNDKRALRRSGGLGLTALCLLTNVVTVVALPHSQRCADFLLAGAVLGLSLAARDRRWAALGQCLGASLLVIGAADARGWPAGGLWACAVGLWYLRGPRPGRRAVDAPARAYRNGSAKTPQGNGSTTSPAG